MKTIGGDGNMHSDKNLIASFAQLTSINCSFTLAIDSLAHDLAFLTAVLKLRQE